MVNPNRQEQQAHATDCPPPFSSRIQPRGLVPDILALLALLEGESFRLLKSGHLPKRLVDGFHAHKTTWTLGEEESSSVRRLLDFSLERALEMGLTRSVQSQLQTTSAIDAWLAKPQHLIVQELLQSWSNSRSWDELYRLPNIKVDSTGLRSSPRAARAFFIERLKELEPGQWVDLQAWLLTLREEHGQFYRPLLDQRGWRLKPIQPEQDLLLIGEGDWYEIEGRLLLSMLVEPAFWLGLTAIGLSSDGSFESFQLTPLGAVALGLLEPGLLEDSSSPRFLSVQSNFEILVPRELDLEARYQVERFAERISSEEMLAFRFTRTSVLQGVDAGHSIEALIECLARFSQHPVPQNVLYSLRNWTQLHGQLQLRPALLLEGTAPEHLLPLLHDPGLQEFLPQSLSSTVSEVDAPDLDAFLSKLRQKGFWPRVAPSLERGMHPETLDLNDEEAYFLALGLLLLRERASSFQISAQDPSLQKALKKMSQLASGRPFQAAERDSQRVARQHSRLEKREENVLDSFEK